MHSLSVIGLGPAGRCLAHRASARGLRVTGYDPNGGSLPSTIGMWERELPEWLGEEAVGKRFFPVVIDSTGKKKTLDDGYLVLDNPSLRGLTGFEVRRELVGPDAGQVNTVNSDPLQVRQFAFGAVLPESAVPEVHREPVLMDFRGVSDGPATFSYRIPLAGDRWLIEETILVSRMDPAAAMDLVRANLTHRLSVLGIDGSAVLEHETVNFPVGPARLPSRRGPQKFGVAGGWMHPATGYSVGAMLADVDRVLDRVSAGRSARPRGGLPLMWLRRRGLAVLLAFDPDDTRTFFDAFFALPGPLIHNYLTGRGGVPGTLAAMASLLVPLVRRSPTVLGTLLGAFFTHRL